MSRYSSAHASHAQVPPECAQAPRWPREAAPKSRQYLGKLLLLSAFLFSAAFILFVCVLLPCFPSYWVLSKAIRSGMTPQHYTNPESRLSPMSVDDARKRAYQYEVVSEQDGWSKANAIDQVRILSLWQSPSRATFPGNYGTVAKGP